MATLSLLTQRLIRRYQDWYQSLSPKQGTVNVKVDEVASKVATFYEKIRQIVDWQEQHLMRRIAIERILKRRLFLRRSGNDNIAEAFVFELIRGGYFPNDFIKETKIQQIQKILDKYTFILGQAPKLPKSKTQSEFYGQIMGIAACEIEETLDPSFYLKENALIEYMEVLIKERIKVGKRALKFTNITENEKNIQIYIAVQQALFKLDLPIISYNLIKRQYPFWSDLSQPLLEKITQNIYSILDQIEQFLSHPLAGKFYKICERYDTIYLLLGDVIAKNPMEIQKEISQPEVLEKLIDQTYTHRLKTLKSRLGRAAFYSTISIFLTNIFVLYVLEFPFAKYVTGNINVLAAIVDVAAPTFLMFVLVVTIKSPPKKNRELVLTEVKKIVYENQSKDLYEVEIFSKRHLIFRIINKLMYFISFCVCFGLILLGLYKLNYPPLSYLLLIIFTSLIAFAGTKIRQRSKELHVIEEKDSLFQIIIDLFSLPVIRVGKWLSTHWRKINIINVIFNILIDTPFLIFLEFLEQWRYFLKEKKEDIR